MAQSPKLVDVPVKRVEVVRFEGLEERTARRPKRRMKQRAHIYVDYKERILMKLYGVISNPSTTQGCGGNKLTNFDSSQNHLHICPHLSVENINSGDDRYRS